MSEHFSKSSGGIFQNPGLTPNPDFRHRLSPRHPRVSWHQRFSQYPRISWTQINIEFNIKKTLVTFYNNLNILPIIEKIPEWTPKNQKFQNPSTTHKFYVDLGPKRYLGPRDPIIGSIVMGGGLN